MELLQKKPTIIARNGNKALAKDAKIMQAHVILGTIADTVLHKMEDALKARIVIKKIVEKS